VHAQCTDVFRWVLTRSAEAVLPVRYELDLKCHLGEFPTVWSCAYRGRYATVDGMRRWTVCDGGRYAAVDGM
jgi:hypothetical protein